jgi:hypothetical protein
VNVRRVADPLDDVLGGSPNGHRPPPAPMSPTVERHGDDFAYTWRSREAVITVERIREHSDGTHAETTVTVSGTEIHWGRLNLVSTSAREQLVKKLTQVLPDDEEGDPIPWRAMLERVCRDTTKAARMGSPAVLLRPQQATGPSFLVEPFLPLGDTSVVFADGGSGKGWKALTLALAAMNALSLPGGIRFAATRPTHVLYADWESTQADLEDRVWLLARGLGCHADGLHYRRMDRALADDAAALRADVSRLGVGLVIVDSLAPACGPEPEGADAVTRTFNARRSLGPNVTRLVIAHVSKAGAEQRGPAKPYGSAFVWNLARSVWELRRGEDDSDGLVMAAYHRKANRGKLHPPIGLRFTFAPDSVALASTDLADSPDLLARGSVPQRIRTVLRPGALTTAEIAEAIGAPEDTVSRNLRRMTGVLRLPDTKPAKWGLTT